MRDSASTRRGFLTVAGATLLAGCSGLDQFSESPPESVPSSRLPDVGDDGDSDPTVVDSVPVDIERVRLEETTQRVTALLGTLPVPFGPDAIPNGHVRQRLVDAATDATERVEDARTAQSRLTALQSLREARSRARYAAAGWAFVDSGTTKEELQTEHRQVVSKARSVRTNHEYLGTDLVRAVLVHARVEQNLERVFDDRGPSGRGGSGPLLTVAERGEYAESARALVADSRYLYGRFTSSLPADAGTVEQALTTAAESVGDDLRSRREELPAEPTESDDELTWRLQYRLRDAAASGAEQVAEAVGPASAVLARMEGLTDFLAYDRVRGRIEDGEQFRVEDASGVREARSRALEAIRTGLEQSPRPELARPVLADAAATVAYADEELSRYRGDVRVARLDDPVRRYAAATARARSVPAACRQVLDALET